MYCLSGTSVAMENSRSATKPPNLAFYYPGWIWRDADALKNLLLFFDGIALLVPAYMRDRVHQVDELFTSRLSEAGLLKILEPEELVDKAATEKLAQSWPAFWTPEHWKRFPEKVRAFTNSRTRVSVVSAIHA